VTTLGGHIVTTRYGGPRFGYCETITVYPTHEAAAGVAARSNQDTIAEALGPFTAARVEIRIVRPPEAGPAERTEP